jgi:membrane-associated phospholipid phosphatase
LLAQPSDTTKISTEPLFVKGDLFVGAAFVIGAFAAHPVDKYFAEKLRRDTSQLNDLAENAGHFFEWMGSPGPMLIGPALYAAGKISGNRDMADLGLHGTEAVIIGSALVTLGKGLGGRARPYKDPENTRNFKFNRGWKHEEYRSFPSGHSLAGFAAAAAVTAETSRWWPRAKWVIGPVMYGGAALIATSRMYHNKHWASDVIMGAGIGTFAGLKVVKYHHSHPNNRIDRWLLSTNLAPGADGSTLIVVSLVPGEKPAAK